ncbi:MAG TPA: ketopantoate reductase C-terminal domain-containing protein [Candidatus Binatia bacterium]|nr:ketopantoate reductase C-terminal domain-containing protein [Candidatus Binatia bacterium]
MGCRRVAPGHVQTAIRGHLYTGHLHGERTRQLETLNALPGAVIPSEMTDNILGVFMIRSIFILTNPWKNGLPPSTRWLKHGRWRTERGPLRQIQRGITTEVDYTLGHVIEKGEKLKIPTPLCRKLLTMIHELEQGQRRVAPENYGEL